MTDIPSPETSVPGRFALNAHLDGDRLRFDLTTQPEILVHGVIRASVLAYLVDAAAGISVDEDPDVWTLTTDLTLRMVPVAAPELVESTTTIVRRGRRSVTITFEVTEPGGGTIAAGAIGFASLPRRDGDPPKPMVTNEVASQMFTGRSRLTEPLREAAAIEVLDPDAGVVQVMVTPELQNPAGTLQGAMVALLAEVAAEELAGSRTDQPVVVTDLDLRYLAQTTEGPVRTRSRLLGTKPDDPIEIELIDTTTDTLTTLVYARAQILT